MLNILQNARLIRGLQLGLYGCGGIAAGIEMIVSSADARLPWFIVMLFSFGCLVDAVRNEKAVP